MGSPIKYSVSYCDCKRYVKNVWLQIRPKITKCGRIWYKIADCWHITTWMQDHCEGYQHFCFFTEKHIFNNKNFLSGYSSSVLNSINSRMANAWPSPLLVGRRSAASGEVQLLTSNSSMSGCPHPEIALLVMVNCPVVTHSRGVIFSSKEVR